MGVVSRIKERIRKEKESRRKEATSPGVKEIERVQERAREVARRLPESVPDRKPSGGGGSSQARKEAQRRFLESQRIAEEARRRAEAEAQKRAQELARKEAQAKQAQEKRKFRTLKLKQIKRVKSLRNNIVRSRTQLNRALAIRGARAFDKAIGVGARVLESPKTKTVVKATKPPIVFASKPIKALFNKILEFEKKQAKSEKKGKRAIDKIDKKLTKTFKKATESGNQGKKGFSLTQKYFELFGVKFFKEGERKKNVDKFLQSFNQNVTQATTQGQIDKIIFDAKKQGVDVKIKEVREERGKKDLKIELDTRTISPTSSVGNALIGFTDLVFKGTLFSPLTGTITASKGKGGKVVVKKAKPKKKTSSKQTKNLLRLSEELFKKNKLNAELRKLSNEITKSTTDKQTKINNFETLLTELKKKDLIKGFIFDRNSGAVRFMDQKGRVAVSQGKINPQGELIINIEKFGSANIPREFAGIIKGVSKRLSKAEVTSKKVSIRKTNLEGLSKVRSNLEGLSVEKSNLISGISKTKTRMKNIDRAISKIKSKSKPTQKDLQRLKSLQKSRAKTLQQSTQQSKQLQRTRQKLKTQQKLQQKLKRGFRITRRIRPKKRLRRKIRIPLFKRGKKKVSKKKGKPVEAFNVLGKVKGKFVKLNSLPLTKRDALSKGAFAVDNSTSATFKIEPIGKKEKVGKLLKGEKSYFTKNKKKFRGVRIKKGRKFKLTNKFIEKKKKRIDTRGERKGLSVRKFIVRRSKPVKAFNQRKKITLARRKQLLTQLKKARAVRMKNMKKGGKKK